MSIKDDHFTENSKVNFEIPHFSASFMSKTVVVL
jgi:hypothetical protein